jgi:signal transduction histidine kinase
MMPLPKMLQRPRRESQQLMLSLRRRATELEKLQLVNNSLAHVVSEEETLHLIVESLLSLGYCFAAFLALDRERGVLTDYMFSTDTHPLIEEAQRIIPLSAELPLSCQENVAVKCIQTLEVQTTKDLAQITTPLINPVASRLLQRVSTLKGIAVVPVLVGAQPFGVWIAGSDRQWELDEADLRTLTTFADQAGLAIERAQLYDSLRRKTDTLEKALRELKATQDQLVRSERLYSIGRLAATIAHEVNNPLQVVRTRLELAMEGMDAGEPVGQEELQIANREIVRVAQILQGLSNLLRPTEETESLVAVNDAVQEVLTLMDKQLRRQGVTVVMDLTPTSPQVLGRGNQLKQVFLNLVLNALEAMPRGGKLHVATALPFSDEALISFSDTGPGIPPARLAQIFEPFYTTKAQGLGLGLAVCLTIVEAHGGRISAQSEEGQGTCFQIRLPAFEERSDGISGQGKADV